MPGQTTNTGETMIFEVAIAGQGLAGSLLAWELAKCGIDFRVFDPGDGRSASMAAGGLYFPLAARKLKEVDLSAQQLPLMKLTFSEIEKNLGKQFLYERPSLKLIKDDELESWVQAKRNELSHLISDIIPGIQLKGVVSGYHGVVISESGFVDVPGFVNATRDWLVRHNLLITEKVSGNIIEDPDKHLIINNRHLAEKLVFCEGPAAAVNPLLTPGTIRMNKGELIEIEATGLQEDYILRREIFVLPVGKGRFRVGATYSHEFHDYEPSVTGLRELTSKLEQIINTPYKIVGHWAGLRPTTRNRLPVYGSLPGSFRMFVLNGLGSRGVIQGPWYAKELTKHLTVKA
jgi:glycine/D-amino acid oxidase-like deaminating enzyme